MRSDKGAVVIDLCVSFCFIVGSFLSSTLPAPFRVCGKDKLIDQIKKEEEKLSNASYDDIYVRTPEKIFQSTTRIKLLSKEGRIIDRRTIIEEAGQPIETEIIINRYLAKIFRWRSRKST